LREYKRSIAASEGEPKKKRQRKSKKSKPGLTPETPPDGDDDPAKQGNLETNVPLTLEEQPATSSQPNPENTGTTLDAAGTAERGDPPSQGGDRQVPGLAQERIMQAMLAEIYEATVDDVPGEIFCYKAMFPAYAGEDEMDPLQVYKATADPDTMYMHQAMKQPDAAKFKEAMQKEWDDQLNNGNFSLIKRSEVPEGALVLPTVWQMKRKRDILTRAIKKYKARLNVDGSRMKKGLHYDQTYAPVAKWNSIRTMLIMSALHGWHTKQIDYVLAFPQAPVERELYISIPRGFEIEGGRNEDYVLKLHRNVYGQAQSGRVWYQYLSDILDNKVGFVRSEVDECVFYRGNVMCVLYTDDSILAGPDQAKAEQAIEDIKAAKLNITVEGDIKDFLGVNIERMEDGSVILKQPHLIDQILEDLKMDEKTKSKPTPASSSKLLSRHSKSEDFDNSFNYRSVIGKLNYLEKGTRSDIAYITHQCARFTTCPKKEHGEAIR